MSRSDRRVSAASTLALAVALVLAAPAFAHAPGAAIQLDRDVIRPGESVNVYGQNMNPDEPILFELGDATQAVPLTTVAAGGDGSVTAVLEVPWQTPKGNWTVYARGTDGDVVTAPLALAGVPINPEDEEGEPPDEEDPLTEPTPSPGTTAPAPSGSAAAAPVATMRPRTLPPQPIEAAVTPPGPPPPDPGLWLVAASGGIGLLVLLVLALWLRRRPSSSA